MIWTGALFRAHRTLVQPLLILMVAPFVEGNDANFSLQINGNLLWEWRTLEGSLKKLFAVFQTNLGAIGYRLEESAFGLVAIQLRTRTTNFLKQMKAERNGKRRSRKKAETWKGLSLYPKEILKTPYDIVTQMKKTKIELRRTNGIQSHKKLFLIGHCMRFLIKKKKAHCIIVVIDTSQSSKCLE